MTLLEKYMWVVKTLYESGERGLSLKELNVKWMNDSKICSHEPLPRQTFDRWKGNISMALGITIECQKKGYYRYYIANPEELSERKLGRWLLDTYSTANTLAQCTQLKDRILVEDVPSSQNFLTRIIEAMKKNVVLTMTHKSFQSNEASTFPVEPYCLKMFQKRWYLLARNVNQDKIRLYGLDRMEDIQTTDSHFTLPKDFNAEECFSSFFGIVMDESVPVQRIVLRAIESHQHYMRSLPLHPSQKEIFSCEEYADFELTLRPTYDFCLELLHAGNMLEVMEPQSLRETMKSWVKEMWDMYDDTQK